MEGDDYKLSHHFRKRRDDQSLFGSSMILRTMDELWWSNAHSSYANAVSRFELMRGERSDAGATHVQLRQWHIDGSAMVFVESM